MVRTAQSRDPSRRRFITELSTAALAAAIPPRSKAAAAGLGRIAAESGYFFGAAAGPPIDTDAAYRDLYAAEAGVITTDIALKIGTVAPQPGPKRFDSADRLLQFCTTHGIRMRGHCIAWNEWVPAWIKQMDRRQRQSYLDSYVDEVAARYARMLHSWDVVNEPFWPGHGAPGGYRIGPWYDAFGPDYVRRALLRVAAADPRALLVINEAHTEREDDLGHAIRRGLLRLVDELKQAGVPLHAVGLQGHLQPRHPLDPPRFAEFVAQLAGKGVDVYITELDVLDDVYPDEIVRRDAAVAQLAERFLREVLAAPRVRGVVTWQLGDNYSFYTADARRKSPPARLPRPLPFDGQLRPKPLYQAIARAFRTARRA